MTGTELLDFERAHPDHMPPKDDLITAEFGLEPAEYYQLLSEAANSAEGREHDPETARMVVARDEALRNAMAELARTWFDEHPEALAQYLQDQYPDDPRI